MAGRIFINDRRGDDPGSTTALHFRLEERFGKARLFMDVRGHTPHNRRRIPQPRIKLQQWKKGRDMIFGDGVFNILIIGPMGITKQELHQRSWLERRLKPSFSPQEHTVAIKGGLEHVLASADGQQALAGQRVRIDIPDEVQGSDIMSDVFNKIDNADLVIADLYLNRPTVYYEIALAHSLGVPVISLTKKASRRRSTSRR